MTDAERYRARYLADLPSERPPTRDAGIPLVDARHWYLTDGVARAPNFSLPQLYVSGVECGIIEARTELRRRVAAFDTDLEWFRALRDRVEEDRNQLTNKLALLQRENLERAMLVGNLETFLREARARVEALETSTTWQATAPLRRSAHRAKIGLSRLRGILVNLRQSPYYASLALSVLRNEGAGALARRVARRLRRPQRFAATPTAAYRQETEITALDFPPSEHPRVSIVIPAFGRALLTYTCLKSVQATAPAGHYEVLVIDDASPVPLSEELAAVSGVHFARNRENLGFIGSCNQAMLHARGDVLVFLNNDTIATAGWIEALLAVFDSRVDAGLVGAKLIYPDGRLQEAGGIVWRDGSAWNDGRDDDADKPEFNYVREVDYCSGACLAVPRALFVHLGGFDTRFAPAYYEDVDLAFAIRQAGRKVYYQPQATIVHFEGATSGTDETSGVKRHQLINQRTFAAKWERTLSGRRANGSEPWLERDRWAKRRVLVIDACMLTPDQDAGSLRMMEMLRLLVELRCKVTFLADNLEYRQPYVSELQQQGVEVLFAPYARSVAHILDARGAEFDVVLVSRHYVAVKYLDTLRTFAPHALIVFDTVDLHFLREERLADLNASRSARHAAAVKRDEELLLMRKADVTLVVSPFEQDLLHRLAPESRVLLLSTIHEPSVLGASKRFADREGLVFIGGFRHPPNIDAVLWYAAEVLPRIRERLPDVKTYIIGSDAPPIIASLAADDFVITGFVPDVTPYFTGCRVSVSPLRYGAGVKGKVNLAMSYGLPVVATTPSIEGMRLTPGDDVLVADEPEAFADAVTRAYTDQALWARLAEGGRKNIRRYFSPEVARATLVEVLMLESAGGK